MVKRILVVDDSKVSRMLIVRAIRKLLPEWEACEAKDGHDALEQWDSEQPFDMMAIDLNMPGMSGLELAERLKNDGVDIPMALITANIQETVQRRAEDLGLRFVRKPVSKEKIANALCELGITDA